MDEAIRRMLRGRYNQTAQNNYAAGQKRYGASASDAPTVGPVDPTGYRERDANATAVRNAALRRLRARQAGRYFSEDNLSPQPQNVAVSPLNQVLGWYS